MNNDIIHRGPDDDGVYVDISSSLNVGMGMRRLSIIDVNSGHQPMISKDSNIIIIFNGEIYNYLELKKLLIGKGVCFDTNSDTEVILKLYVHFGNDVFSMLDGMFAISIYDKNRNVILIARDFFGEKPLYFYKEKSSFYFSSELKSIINVIDDKPKINIDALNIYFQFTYIPAPLTIYNDIYKLNQNTFIEYDLNSNSYKISDIENKYETFNNITKENAADITKKIIFKSVQNRTISDVPLGAFLSGGVDSSIISMCYAKQNSSPINTFSIGFENSSFDESDKSNLVAKIIGSNHNLLIIGDKDLKYNVNDIILNFDEPFADSSCIPSYILAENTRKYVKVALTGDGADEVFLGYNKYLIGKLNSDYIKVIPKFIHENILKFINKNFTNKKDNRGLNFKLLKLLNSISYDRQHYKNILSLGFKENELNLLLNFNNLRPNSLSNTYIKTNNLQSLKDFRNFDYLTSLEGDMLTKIDRTSMLASLECRSPFLNKDLWNFTAQLPDDLLIKNFEKKYILKEAFKSDFPKNFLNKSKKGFGVPVGDWLRTIFKNELLTYIDKNLIDKQLIFNFSYISKLVEDHLNFKADNTFKVWSFYCFQKWYFNKYEKN